MNSIRKIVAASALSLALAAGSYAALSSTAAQPAVETKTAPAPAAAGAKTFKVDSAHSSVFFKIKHMNAANFYGRFNKVEGSFDLAGNVLEATVDAASVDTNSTGRDNHVKSPDFFSVKEFPTITFKGTSFTKKDDTNWEVKGDLSFHGKTKEVVLNVANTGQGPGRGGGTVAGIETTFTIKRSDFGMDFMLKGLSDDVTLTISLEGGAK